MKILLWLRIIIFYPMMWLRGLFLWASNVIGGLFFIGGLIFLLGGFDKWIALMYFGLSFGIFVLKLTYDQILLRLNPTGHDLVLFQ